MAILISEPTLAVSVTMGLTSLALPPEVLATSLSALHQTLFLWSD